MKIPRCSIENVQLKSVPVSRLSDEVRETDQCAYEHPHKSISLQERRQKNISTRTRAGQCDTRSVG